MSVPRPTTRERRTIAIGVLVAAVAIAVTYGVVPFASRWSAREALLDARVERLSRLRALIRDRGRVASAVQARTLTHDAQSPRVLSARSASLAASALQAVLQEYASASRVQLDRIDVASAPDTAGGLPAIPATVGATADIYGLTDLVARIERGAWLLEVVDLSVQRVRGPRGEELLQVALVVRAPYAALE